MQIVIQFLGTCETFHGLTEADDDKTPPALQQNDVLIWIHEFGLTVDEPKLPLTLDELCNSLTYVFVWWWRLRINTVAIIRSPFLLIVILSRSY